MSIIEKNISNFIETQFPEIYREEGPQFVSFVKQYYEWLESSNNAIYHSRNLLDYKDVDLTVDDFIVYFKEKYLKDIQFDTVTQTRRLIKNSLDLYRSKGTERSVDLFFRAVFGKPAEVYYPGDDVFRLSDGRWVKPKYLEVTPSSLNETFVNKQITGVTSGATAFVERFIRRKISSKYIHILYISAIAGEFQSGELIYDSESQALLDAPTIIGSLTTLDIVTGGADFSVGDIVSIETDYGKQGKARVANVSSITGIVDFDLIDSGWGYTANAEVYISEKVVTLKNVLPKANNRSPSPFQIFEQFVQPLANIVYTNANNSFTLNANDELFTYYSNNTLAGRGKVISVATNNISKTFDANTDVNNADDFITLSNNTIQNNKIVLYTTNTGNTVLSGLANNTLYYAVQANSTGLKLSLTSGGGPINITASATSENGHNLSTYAGEIFVSETYGNLSPVKEPAANLSGTIFVVAKTVPFKGYSSINTTSANIDGTGTTYTSEVLPGSIVYIFAYNSSNTFIGTEPKRVVSVINNTRIVVDSNLSFTSTKAIIKAANSRALVGTGTTFTTDFAYGDTIALYTNSTNYVLNVVNAVTNDTFMTVQQNLSFTNSAASYANTITNNYIYKTSNTSRANISTITTRTATGNIIGSSANLVMQLANVVGKFTNNNIVYQLNANNDQIASATISRVGSSIGSNLTLFVSNSSGVFQPNTNLTIRLRHANGLAISSTANLVSYDMSVGLISITNTLIANHFVYGTTLLSNATIDKVSSGILANFEVSNTLQYSEQFQICGDLVSRFLTIPLDAEAYGFPRSPNANGQTQYMSDIFTNTSVTMGGVASLVSINPGKNYDTSPFVLIYEPKTADADFHDYSMEIKNAVSVFTPGEVVEQNNGATGIIRFANSTNIIVKRTQFQNVFDLSLALVGQYSGATANIVAISAMSNTLPIGLNSVVLANVETAEGYVTKLEVVDSGFGYEQGENAVFTSVDGLRSGSAKVNLGKKGISEGFYENRKGFISDTKKIFDGEYYQDYSYEVRTSVTADKYSEMLKKVLHVAGTKQFSAVVFSSAGSLQSNVSSSITKE